MNNQNHPTYAVLFVLTFIVFMALTIVFGSIYIEKDKECIRLQNEVQLHRNATKMLEYELWKSNFIISKMKGKDDEK